MVFISLGRFRKKPTKEATTEVSQLMQEMKKEGIKFFGFYWTLGRYERALYFPSY